MGARTRLLAAAAVVAQVVGPVVAPPAAPWAAPGVGLACQAQLNAFCNNASINTDCYNASLAPWFGLFDHNGSPDGVANSLTWRCYSHGCLDPVTHRYNNSLAGPPSGHVATGPACGLCTNPPGGPGGTGGALQAICTKCAGTAEGVSHGQCLPAPRILESGPSRLPIQRAAAASFTVRGNFTGATSAAACRVNGDTEHVGPLTVLNASAASCRIPCTDNANQSAGCWFVKVEGSGTISASLDGETFSNTLPVTFFHLALAQIGRRPYISESAGSILLKTDKLALGGASLAVEAELPCVPGKRWTWPNVSGGTDTVLPLSLDGLPASLHNDLCVTLGLPSGERLPLWRRFLRVPPPPAGATARAVQVDHERAGLLVSSPGQATATPFLGVGYYITEYGVSDKKMINAVGEHPTNSTATLIRELQRMGKRGVTWALVYWCYYVPFATAQDQLAVLDAAHAANVSVIWDSMPAVTDFIKDGGPYNDSSKEMAWLKANVSLVKDHPGLLGYYICDDCCTSGVARMAQVYALFKELDPYHPTIGAVNCDDGHSFSDGQPGTEPAEVDRTEPVLPYNKQPALQLSLDIPMLENYGTSIASHVDDGSRVQGLWREPKVNCPPNFGIGAATYSAPSAPVPALPAAQYRTLLWLGVIQGSMTNQLNFDIGCETPPCTLPQLSDTFYSFGSELQALRPSLYAAFGQTSLPTVAIVNHSANAGLLGRVYAESSACLHLVLANTDTGRASSFTAAFSQPVPTTATILFTADYSVQLASHNLTDWVAPGQTNVYRIGGNCTVLKSDEHIHMSPHHRREQPVGRDYSVPPAIVHAGQQTFGLNVRDFGAVGDGVTDDTEAINRALNTTRARTLLFPAGSYMISAPLTVGYNHAGGGVRIVGEGMYTTGIYASANFSGQGLLVFEGKPTNPIPQHGPLGEITGSTTGDQEVAHIALGVNGLADFALFAPLITRSRFVSVLFSGANVAGLFLGYGWCNAVLDCRAEENVIGFFFTTAANNINVIDNILEGNHGIGIYITDGYQARIEGNVIEGNEGPGIVASSMNALTITGNYFEANNGGEGGVHFNMTVPGHEPHSVNSDILLGVDVATDRLVYGTPFPWTNQPGRGQNISFVSGAVATHTTPRICVGVTLTGNHHSPAPARGNTSSAVLLAQGRGVKSIANTCYWAQTADDNQCALFTIGSDCTQFRASEVSWEAVSVAENQPTNSVPVFNGFSRWVDFLWREVSSNQTSAACGLHTFSNEGAAHRNFALSQDPRAWRALGMASVSKAEEEYDARAVFYIQAESDAPTGQDASAASGVVLRSVDLATTPSMAGQLVHVALHLNTSAGSPDHFTLAIDNGNGHFVRAAGSTQRARTKVAPEMSARAGGGRSGGFAVYTHQAELGLSGAARFALLADSACLADGGCRAAISGPFVVAVVGTPMDDAQ